MAGMGKVKALQIWCKNRVNGYQNVEVSNMTTSWRDGLAFCALIHRFRPDLIDFDSLSKENVFENNALAFQVAESLGVPALLDAEDMVRLETPDKLSIITYVAQLHNYFKDKEQVGGPDVKMAAKRPSNTNVHRSTSITSKSPASKRKPTPVSTNQQSEEKVVPGSDICVICDGKVYLIEKHIQDGKMYHRSCYKRNNRRSDTSAYITPPPTSLYTKPTDTTDAASKSAPQLTTLNTRKANINERTTPSPAEADTRPEWQKRVLNKTSAVKRLSGLFTAQMAADAKALDPVCENGGSSYQSGASRTNITSSERLSDISAVRTNHNTGAIKSNETGAGEPERVQLRSRGPPVTGSGRVNLPRAVSSGASMAEKIAKLREIRESTRDKDAHTVKARLGRLQAKINSDANAEKSQSAVVNDESEQLTSKEGSQIKATSSSDEQEKEDVVSDQPKQLESTESSNSQNQDGAQPTHTEPMSSSEKDDQMKEEVNGESIKADETSAPEDVNAASASNPFEESDTPNPENAEEPMQQDETNSFIENEPIEQVMRKMSLESNEAENQNGRESASHSPNPFTSDDQILEVAAESKTTDPSSTTDPESSEQNESKEACKSEPSDSSTVQNETATATLAMSSNKATASSADSGNIPTRPKRASSIKTIKISPPSSARSSLTPVQDKTDDVISPAPRRLSAVSITVSSSPSNPQSVTSSNTSLASNLQSPDNDTRSGAATETSTELTPQPEAHTTTFQDNDGSKSPKPPRPAHSPAVKTPSFETTKMTPPARPSEAPARPTESPAVMRHKKKEAPARPVTVATGSRTKSQFYMNDSHTEAREPPPKPARQSVVQQASTAVNKAKDSWEGALDSWASKRKETRSSIWYSSADYPSEINPFGDDEESSPATNEDTTESERNTDNHNNTMSNSATLSTANYDDSLNPFASGDEEEGRQDSVNIPPERKVIHANPFEVSDDDNEDLTAEYKQPEAFETPSRRKIIPDPEYPLTAEPKKSKDIKDKGIPLLPKASPKIHKKKHAPAPPTGTSPANQRKLLLDDPTSSPKISQKCSSMQGVNESTPDHTNLEDSMEKTTPDVHMRKSKPAPPRPMPPKRRVVSDFGVTEDDVQTELETIERKQRELEEKGRRLEEAIRKGDIMTSSKDSTSSDDDQLLSSWLETINEKNHLIRRETELVFIAKHQELESQQADIEWELRTIMHQAENLKTDEDKAKEEELLQKLVTVVHERSKLVDKMDEEKRRQQEEDEEINAVLGNKFNSAETSGKPSKAQEQKKTKDKGKKKKKPKS